ncbi:MAG: hypothetical protein ABSE69_12970 [Roseiarcus sp.]|jgi:hypothetical protein
MTKAALILAIAIVIGGFLAGGRYTSASSGGAVGGAFVVDRFTGATSWCGVAGACHKIENSD